MTEFAYIAEKIFELHEYIVPLDGSLTFFFFSPT